MNMRSLSLVCAAALLAWSLPPASWAEEPTLEAAWAAFNASRYGDSAGLCQRLLERFPDDPEKTPAILLLSSLNHDHLADQTESAEHQEKAKSAAEAIIRRYPASKSAAEAFFYLGELYSGNVPVKIETDCGKALPMFAKAIEKAGKQWIKDESRKGIERCKIQPLTDAAQKLYDLREFDLALPIFQRIVARDPGSESAQNAQMMAGLCYEGLGRLEEALKAYEDCIKDYKPYPGDALFYYYASALDVAGRVAEARTFYNKVIGDPASRPWAVRSAQAKLKKLKDAPGKAPGGLDAVVSVRLKDASLSALLDAISEQARVNFILTEDSANRPVTADFPKAAAREVLDKTLPSRGLALHRIGQSSTYLVLRAGRGAPVDPGAGIQDPNLDKKVELRFRAVPLSVFLDAVSAQTGLKFRLSEDISQLKMTAFLKDVSAREALSVATLLKGLTYRRDEATGAYILSRSR